VIQLTLSVFTAAALALAVAKAPAAEPPDKTVDDAAEERPDNTPPKGFVSLLPGKEMDGWKGRIGSPLAVARMSRLRRNRLQRLADSDMLVHWKVTDGVLEFDGKGKSISTERVYCNFELYVDWKIPKGGKSGIYLRGYPKVQIWDATLEDVGAEVGSGGLFNNKDHPSKPLVKADRPTGEWNTFHIKMVSGRVTVKLNGTPVVNDVVLENHWTPDRPIHFTGPIELEANGSKLYFKNIYLRELPRK